MSDEVTIADNYGDTATVSTDGDLGTNVYLNAVEGDYETNLSYPPADAIKLADALYEAAGADAKPHPDAVLASSVSFNEAALRLAAAHNRVASFSYSKGQGTVIEHRRLQPESFSESQGHVVVTGFDPDRNDPRAYRLDRIVGEVSL